MPGIFSRRKKDAKSKKNGLDDADLLPQKKQWDDAWTRKTVEPEEIRELLHGCCEELKSRGRPFTNAGRWAACHDSGDYLHIYL